MPYSLTYNDLPSEINQWPGLPLSLSGSEVMPLDYRAGNTGWLIYGIDLDKLSLSGFQGKLGIPLVVVNAWQIDEYHVVRIAGAMPKQAKKIADEMKLDIAALGTIPQLRTPGLLVMDMDSTAIEIECIDEIARLAGTGDEVSEITRRAMNGEMEFPVSLRKRVATLKGADASILEHVLENLPLTSGLKRLVDTLQEYGWHITICSGGFSYFADALKNELGLTDAVANDLEVKDGKLTGRVCGAIVDGKYKAGVLQQWADKLNIPESQIVAIGDGANDLKMLQAAGLGIAYHAKPKVQAKAKVGIRHADLTGVLCILSASVNYEERS